MGRVVEPGPDVKLASTKSSRDRVNASRKPAIRAGAASGNVMVVNGGIVSNAGNVNLSANASYNNLVISNGGKFFFSQLAYGNN